MSNTNDVNVLTFDVGTQSSRTMLIDSHGQILGKKQIIHEPAYNSPKPGWAEKDADVYYKYLCEASLYLKQTLPLEFEKIAAVTVTTIRDTVVNIDKNGKPLRPAIVWLDERNAEGEPKLTAVNKTLLKAIGMDTLVSLQYKKSSCNWIMQNQPDIWKETDKYLLLSGYISYCLTGDAVDADACLVGHIPFDVKTGSWYAKNAMPRPIFDIPAEKLPKIIKTGKELGRITSKAAELTGLKEGLPVIASGADKACEIIGLGCVEKTQAAVSFGTTSTITFNTPEYLEAEKFYPPYPSAIPDHYCPEYELYRGYWLVSWFKNEFAQEEAIDAAKEGKSVEEILDEGLSDVSAGCEGLFLSPYFTPDVSQPYARGAFVGLADYHTKKHMYRAIIEGVNYSIMEGMRKIEERGKFKFREIRVGGGGSKSAAVCQIAADMFGIPVLRTQTHENTGVGSAMTAFVSLGIYKDFKEAADGMIRISDTFLPNEENHQKYLRLFEVYKKIYPALKGIYEELSKIYPR